MPLIRHALALPALLVTACVSTEAPKNPVDPVVLQEHETRLIAPYEGGNTVVCQRLVIDANPVLFHHLTLPAGKPARASLPGVEELTWASGAEVKIRPPNRAGAQPLGEQTGWKVNKFQIMIGTTAFLVDDRVTVRRLFRAPPTLTARASGHVMVIRNDKTASKHEEVRFVDGRVEAR